VLADGGRGGRRVLRRSDKRKRMMTTRRRKRGKSGERKERDQGMSMIKNHYILLLLSLSLSPLLSPSSFFHPYL